MVRAHSLNSRDRVVLVVLKSGHFPAAASRPLFPCLGRRLQYRLSARARDIYRSAARPLSLPVIEDDAETTYASMFDQRRGLEV